MRFGCCVEVDQVSILAQAGYDFCELPARAVRPSDDEPAALPALRAAEALPLRPEAFNSLIPLTLPLVGPTVDRTALQIYLRRAFTRMAQIGGQVAVLGSGGARRIPEGWPRDQALDQLADALALAVDEAGHAGIELALEHLNQGECNVFTTIAECQVFIAQRGLAGLRLLVDLHHIEAEQEPLAHVVGAAPLLAHVHVADGGRRAPGVGGYEYAGFMAVLRQAGYDRRISAECGWENLTSQAAGALDFMREQWGHRPTTKD
ncbi:MAG TPA: sugar phosphate isomerase/epimerase family protein [Roseiflexaceae bacterium]|nr:sugar phosphate isomerase/epimerase family protein [Roseiflexaceae bacterium]